MLEFVSGAGQVLVNGLRVRVRLDEGRLTELLRGHGDAATTAGLLACLGDLATVSFESHLSGAPHTLLTGVSFLENCFCRAYSGHGQAILLHVRTSANKQSTCSSCFH